MTDNFSNKICSVCDFQLIEFCNFRENMIAIQESLASFEDLKRANEEPETEVFVCSTDHSYILVESSDVDSKPRSSMKADQEVSRDAAKPEHDVIKSEFFQCDLCGFSSRSKVYFNRHMKRHESGWESKRNVCQTCHEAFASIFLLNQHRSKTHRAKVHLCDTCGKGFNGPSALEVHRKSQHAVWEVACHYCDKLFASQKHLNKHLKYHEGIKFVCDFSGCGKEFILNSLLNEHLKTHSDIKNFHCQICSKSFFLRRQLRKHVNGVYSTKSYSCDNCNYSNSRRDNLRTHYYRSHNLSKNDVDEILAKHVE